MRLRLFLLLMALPVCALRADNGVTLKYDAKRHTSELSNGLVSLRINGKGDISHVRAADTDITGPRGVTTYFSYVTEMTKNGRLAPDTVFIRRQTEDLVEVVYANTRDSVSMRWQVGFIMRRGISGYYTYAIVDVREVNGTLDNGLREARIVHRLNPAVFNYGWVSDDNQGPQPATEILKGPVEKIQDATFRLPDKSIYTKYDYCNYVRNDQLHGMMGDQVGCWLITPSFEWVNGGVEKQELTVHGDNRSPLNLQMFQSQHFGGSTTTFNDGQMKMYGPALVYINTGNHEAMIADAKRQMAEELKAYPYQWMQHPLFPLQRGTVSGTLSIDKAFQTSRMQVVLAQPGGDLLHQGNDYMFWTETDKNGRFSIPNVRPGTYTLYAWALNGEATGLYEQGGIIVKAGTNEIGKQEWKAPRLSKTLWRIGEADHSAKGFRMSDHHRQYGLFKDVPADLTFRIGKSREADDWYYAQTKNGRWNIIFKCDETFKQPLLLTIATAGAVNRSRANVILNGKRIGQVKTDNDSGVYRSAMQSGRSALFTFPIDPKLLQKGSNTLTLEAYGVKSVGGIMYDIIKLEAQQ